MTNLDSILKSRDITLSTKVPFSQGSGFSISHVWMWELGYKESWALKNRCFWSVVLEKTLESPLACKEIQPAHPKENQSWIFIGKTDAETETPILWPHDAKKWLIGKEPDAGKNWKQEEKGTTEDEIVDWCHWFNGHEFEQALRVGDGQGGLACYSPWGLKVLHTTGWLNWIQALICSPPTVLLFDLCLNKQKVRIFKESFSLHPLSLSVDLLYGHGSPSVTRGKHTDPFAIGCNFKYI